MSFYTRISVSCSAEASEILIAELSETGFDTFMETPGGFEGFAEGRNYSLESIEEIRQRYSGHLPFEYVLDQVEKENWNEQWERNVEPVIVDDRCLVRASFHQSDRQYQHEIIITPKMSFGTGHHQTTWLMLYIQLELNQSGKDVMDAGCGTAILSIMACQRGALFVDAFDIDEWSVTNGAENLLTNNCPQVRLRQGTIRTLDFDKTFDVVLANINKNILLDEMPEYARSIRPGGHLLLSGFYIDDAADLIHAAEPYGFAEQRREVRENWCALLLRKAE